LYVRANISKELLVTKYPIFILSTFSTDLINYIYPFKNFKKIKTTITPVDNVEKKND
jgi:hypothetical protein